MDIKDLLTAVPHAEKLLNQPPTSTEAGSTVNEAASKKSISDGELLRERARHSSGE